MELKILAALLYFFGLSLRKTSKYLSLFEEISHESVRIYYHRLKKVLKQPRKRERRLIAIDETKLKLEKKLIFIWAAIDVDTKECLAIWASEGRDVWRKECSRSFFSRFKERTKSFWNRSPFNSSFDSVQSWIESFMALYNYWRC